MWSTIEDVNVLMNKTLKKVEQNGNEDIVFTTNDNVQYKMYHIQDCCEHVSIDDIVGDLQDLVGSPITQAEEVNKGDDSFEISNDNHGNSETWTFYKLATIKGSVTIRWYGSSNGYYSERVDFVKL